VPRPSKLTPEQWAVVESRYASGEGASSLAREFGVNEAAIRRKFVRETPKVREAAEKLAEGQSAVAALPAALQPVAIDLAARLRGISDSLADAAHSGARTAAMLHRIANNQVTKIAEKLAEDPTADPMDSQAELQAAAGLTRIGNDAAKLGVDLLAANKGVMTPDDETDTPIEEMTSGQLQAIIAQGMIEN
jgi:hypothetical protein